MQKLITGLGIALFASNLAAMSGELEIQSASDGLKRIQQDAFGVVSLSALKGLADKGRDVSLEKDFPAKNGTRKMFVNVSKSGASVGFHAEVPLEQRGGDYDIELASVQQHADVLGLDFPDGSEFSTTGLTWMWQASEFECKLNYVDESYTSSLLSYECNYVVRERITADQLTGSVLAQYLGIIGCVDSGYFDGGYTPGEPTREALMNVMLEKLHMPPYDEALMEVQADDQDAYFQGYSDCDNQYEFLAAEAEKLGIEADF